MADENDGTITPPEPKPYDPPPKASPTDGSITLTQDELNKKMAENRRNLTRKNEEMAQQLEALQSQITMTAEERDELAMTIETLRTQTMSQEELAKREAKKANEQHAQEVQTLQEQLGQWKNRYEKETVHRAIVDAASVPEQKAFDAEQIVAILGGKTRLTTVKDEETGQESLQVVVAYDHVDEEGKQKKLEIGPSEAVKLMKETKRFQNLFLDPKTPGLGGGPNVDSGSGEPDLNDMGAYMKWREKNKDKMHS